MGRELFRPLEFSEGMNLKAVTQLCLLSSVGMYYPYRNGENHTNTFLYTDELLPICHGPGALGPVCQLPNSIRNIFPPSNVFH